MFRCLSGFLVARVATVVAITVTPLEDVDPAFLARRRALGQDRFDEVWDGILHMVPPPHHEHVQVGVGLLTSLHPLLADAGLEIGYEEGLIPVGEPGWNDYRVPDLMVVRPDVATRRGIEGPPELVVEIRSPGDESYRKLPFYERVAAGEVLIIDRDTRTVRRWVHDGERLTEHPPAEDGRHHLRCLPVQLWCHEGRLHLATPAGTTVI